MWCVASRPPRSSVVGFLEPDHPGSALGGLSAHDEHTSADRLRAPPEVSVRVIADASVALVDHARAERPGLDQVERDVFGDRRQERRAATDDDRVAKDAQLVDEAELDRLRGQPAPPIPTCLSVASSAAPASSATDP